MKQVIVFLAFICIFQISLSCDCKAQKEKIKNDIQTILAGNNLQNEIKNLGWLFTAYEQFVPANELESLGVCEKLINLPIKDLEMIEKFFLFTLNKQAKCEISLDEATKKFVKKELKSNKLDDFYKAFMLSSKYDLEESLESQCNSLPEFFDNTGSGKLKKQSTDSTYKKSPQIYEMAAICFEQKNFTASSAFTKAFDNAINGFLSNSAELSLKSIGCFETGTSALQVTAANVLQISKINQFIQNEQFTDKLNAYMNFIEEGIALHLTPQEKSIIFQLTKIMHSRPTIKLDSTSFELTDKKSIEITGKILDYYEKELENKTVNELQADLYYQDKAINKKLKFQQNDQNLIITVQVDDITQLGIYTLKCSFIQNEKKYSDEIEIKFTTKLEIENMQVDFGYQNERSEDFEFVAPRVEFLKKFPHNLQINQNGFIFIQFRLLFSFYPIQPKLIALRLINSKYTKATNLVIPLLDKNDVYNAIIDLGDPEQIQAYSGEYDLEIIVSDPLLSTNIQWIFVTFDINFKKQIATRPYQDTDYILEPQIQHYFAQPLPDPPKFITMGFIVFLVIALIIFLYGVCKLNLSSDKLFNGISVCLFILCIMAYIGVLVLFWVKINIFQTLFLFLVLCIPTLVTGNFALIALIPKEKEKID